MAWLWIISVGMSDVQLPVWSKDEYGMWTVLRRFETGRAGIRAVHQGLLAMLSNGQICFNSDRPEPIDRGVARDLRLDFSQEDDAFVAMIRPVDYHISDKADTIPNDHEAQLPLYCPKVEELLPVARQQFADNPVTVLVLNTRRADTFSQAPSEPIAAGPLVSKYLAERLNLEWVDGQGQIPTQLAPRTATWVDILTGNEAMEDFAAQQKVVARLNEAMRAWNPGNTDSSRVMVTTSGGMPPLKPLIERAPATCFGQDRVTLFDKPERGPVLCAPLNYHVRVAERELLRFYCAEALRAGDYTGAYGLARRASSQPWATEVHSGLGSLLELSEAPLRLNDRFLGPVALTACRIEMRLCLGDVIGALIRIGTFIESSIWELIARDSRIRALGLQTDHDEECLMGNLAWNHSLFNKKLLDRDAQGQDYHRVLGLVWLWPKWLCNPDGRQENAADALSAFNNRYKFKPRIWRNRFVHGTDIPVEPQIIKTCMMDAHLIEGVGRPFGHNFLAVPEVDCLLADLGAADLTTTVGGRLKAVLNRVIRV